MTRLIQILAVSVPVALMAPSSALAQAQTGTGGGPASTITAPNTSSVGQTVPRGGGAATEGSRADQRTEQQKAEDKISRGICIGCGPK